MRRRRDGDLVGARRSLFFHLGMESEHGRSKAREFVSQLYPHMLYEDVRLGIAPIGGRSESPDFQVSVTSDQDPRVSEMVEGALSRRGYSRDLAGALCDFLQESAALLIVYGEVSYEIVYLSQEEGGDPVAFEFALIPSGTIHHRRGQTIQRIPEALAKERGGEREIELDPENLLTLRLSRELRKALERMTSSLSFLSTNIMPEFVFQYDLADPRRPPFEDAEHVRARKLALAEASRVIGWDARGLFQDILLEYYQLDRMLRFERFKVDLRKLILNGLNDALSRAGARLRLRLGVDVQGLPTAQDIGSAEEELRAGTRPFTEMMSQFTQI